MSSTLHKPEIIRGWIDESGLARGAVAEKAGISRWTLWRMEQGKPCPLENVLTVAAVLKKTATEALTDEALRKFAVLC